MPLTISLQYKWTDGDVERKAFYSLCGDLMLEGVYFDPLSVSCPTADKISTHLMFSMAACNWWAIEHMEILNAYVHLKFIYGIPMFFKEPVD